MLNNQIYIGSTNNLKKRIKEHNDGKSVSTNRYKPWVLHYYEAYKTEKLARFREQKLKYHGNALRELKKRVGLQKSGAGFTLIELLVAIGIVSILSVVGLITYQGIQAKARDSTRKHDLNNLAIALEIYFQQNNGKYITATGGITSCPAPGSTTSAFYTGIASYMSDGIVPKDPKTPQALYCYISSNGSTYTLCANLENLSDPDKNSLCPTGYNFGVVPK